MEEKKPTLHEKMVELQQSLKAPKDLNNTFGKYKYRSNESILKALKPLLGRLDLYVTQDDDIVDVGGRIYVKATSTIHSFSDSISNTAYARESLTKKGMDESQITGTASSYARKYSLNGLFGIDDTKDSDTNESRTECDAREEHRTDAEIKAGIKVQVEKIKGQWVEHFTEKLGECTTDEEFITAIEGIEKKYKLSAPYIHLAHDIHKKWRDENNVEVNNDRP